MIALARYLREKMLTVCANKSPELPGEELFQLFDLFSDVLLVQVSVDI